MSTHETQVEKPVPGHPGSRLLIGLAYLVAGVVETTWASGSSGLR